MIGKGKSIAHGGNGIDYALKKEHAQIIDKHLVIGDNGKEIKNEFKIFQNLNHRCTNNDISFVISPEPKDGSKLTNDDLKAISKDFLKKMNLDKHQAVTVKHSDTEHAHLHIFVNRIDENGNAYKDKHIGFKSQDMADKIAIERNLTRAKVVEQLNKESLKEVKSEILRLSEVAMQHKPTDLNDYILLMKANKVEIKPTINKAGKMQGLRVEFQGHDFKASEIHRTKLSLKILDKEIAKSHEIKRERNQYKGYTR
jgi:hypothetical protein